jgi:hypothetical protein
MNNIKLLMPHNERYHTPIIIVKEFNLQLSSSTLYLLSPGHPVPSPSQVQISFQSKSLFSLMLYRRNKM